MNRGRVLRVKPSPERRRWSHQIGKRCVDVGQRSVRGAQWAAVSPDDPADCWASSISSTGANLTPAVTPLLHHQLLHHQLLIAPVEAPATVSLKGRRGAEVS